MEDTIRAYIAGLIDGEGCITITRRKVKRLKTDNWFYEPQVIVSNTDKRLSDFLLDLCGGWVATVTKTQKECHKPSYHWKITGDNMRRLLKDIIPYLRIKKEQARIVLQFPSYKGNGHKARTQEELKGQEDLWLRMKQLNKRGSPRGRILTQAIPVLEKRGYRVDRCMILQVRQ